MCCFFNHRTIDESLRWLVANGKMKEAKKIVMKACKMNHVEFNAVLKQCNLDSDLLQTTRHFPEIRINNDSAVSPHLSSVQNAAEARDKLADTRTKTRNSGNTCHGGVTVRKYTALDIFKSKTILLNSLIIWYAW